MRSLGMLGRRGIRNLIHKIMVSICRSHVPSPEVRERRGLLRLFVWAEDGQAGALQ